MAFRSRHIDWILPLDLHGGVSIIEKLGEPFSRLGEFLKVMGEIVNAQYWRIRKGTWSP
ncbi:MAG: hypothetical protein H5T33_06160 [Candidatus Methanosuratus sp.]|nr:hypothetical protein [Candidatus Methanosuratincola sp.]